MARKESVLAFGESLNKSLLQIMSALLEKGNRDKFTQGYEKYSQPQLSPELMAGIGGVEGMQARTIPAGPPQPGFSTGNVMPEQATIPDPLSILAMMAQNDPSMLRNPSFGERYNYEKMIAPTYEQEDPTKDVVKVSPFGQRTTVRKGTPKAVKPEYRDITENGGPTYVIRNGILSKKKQRYEGNELIPNEFSYEEVRDESKLDISKQQLNVARQRAQQAQQDGDQTAYRFWQNQADEFDKYVMALGQKSVEVGQSNLTDDQKTAITNKLQADVDAGKVKADYARELARSLNVRFEPKRKDLLPGKRPPLDSFRK